MKKYTVEALVINGSWEVTGDYAIIDGLAYIFQAYSTMKSCDCIEQSECGCLEDGISCDGELIEVVPDSVRFVELKPRI
jgi:hypothetical protein